MDPPENIRIIDQGYLGHLSIEWNKPRSLQNLTDCAVRYQLRFYDTYMKRWRVCIYTTFTLGVLDNSKIDDSFKKVLKLDIFFFLLLVRDENHLKDI